MIRTLVLLCLWGASVSWAQPPTEPGDLWEDTVEAQMSGMPARPQTHRRCSPKGNESAPLSDPSGHCEMLDVRRSASGMAWKMRCEGNLSGSGEIRYEGRDRYQGAWTMDMAGRSMTMKMSGRRVGECDAGEARRQLAAVKQQAASAQRQADDVRVMQCKSAVDNLMPQNLRADSPWQCEPKYKADFCRRLQSAEGFALVGNRRPSMVAGISSGDLKEGAELCGTSDEAISTSVCRLAEQQEALGVLVNGCVSRGYARALVVRECAGRNFSSPPAEKYREFCGAVASDDPTLAGGGTRIRKVSSTAGAEPAPAASEGSPRQEAIEKGRQLLKGLFGR
ncbi:MAG TPA: DUF3617 family protein [Albitalea sp.]|uniref:DUF3617 domain-containing protein n=1 Tax=Piscinibacter sp. TaxID=1903157 RepID=UPI002ED63171